VVWKLVSHFTSQISPFLYLQNDDNTEFSWKKTFCLKLIRSKTTRFAYFYGKGDLHSMRALPGGCPQMWKSLMYICRWSFLNKFCGRWCTTPIPAPNFKVIQQQSWQRVSSVSLWFSAQCWDRIVFVALEKRPHTYQGGAWTSTDEPHVGIGLRTFLGVIDSVPLLLPSPGESSVWITSHSVHCKVWLHWGC
jgi:hypothetical protein